MAGGGRLLGLLPQPASFDDVKGLMEIYDTLGQVLEVMQSMQR